MEQLRWPVVALVGDNASILEMLAAGKAFVGLQQRSLRRLYHLVCRLRTVVHLFWIRSELNSADPFNRLHTEFGMSQPQVE